MEDVSQHGKYAHCKRTKRMKDLQLSDATKLRF